MKKIKFEYMIKRNKLAWRLGRDSFDQDSFKLRLDCCYIMHIKSCSYLPKYKGYNIGIVIYTSAALYEKKK